MAASHKLPQTQSQVDYAHDFKSLAFQSLQTGVKNKSLKTIPKPQKPDEIIHAIGTKTGYLPSIPLAPSAESAPSSNVEVDTFNQDHPKLLKAPLKYDSAELQELAAQLTRDIFTMNPNVSWDTISGLEKSKRLIKEAIVFPIKFPQLFTGLLKPWKGILLYGPPGN
jgi:SpoVK/Ycf46/Vps4 family AAA+-type ATPase